MQDPLSFFRSVLAERLDPGQLELPLLPQVASQVLEMSESEQGDAARLATLIHRDQALAGHVLQIANSAAYAGRVPIVSLQQAVARLGTRVLRELALAACVRNRVFRVPGYETEMQQLWRHATASAGFAREVARRLRRSVEGAFLCGLLHNIGKPLVLQILVEAKPAGTERLDAETTAHLLEEFDAAYGGLLAARWRLPDRVQAAIRHYRSPAEAPAYADEARITGLADLLAGRLLAGGPGDAEGLEPPPVAGELNLYPEDLAALWAEREKVLELVESMAL